MDSKRIVITGALGMLGKVLVEELLCSNYSGTLILIDIIDDKAFLHNLHTDSIKVIYVKADILDKKALEKILIGCDIVYHLAGFISYNRTDYDKMSDINIEATRLITELSEEAHVKKLIYASSISSVSLLKSVEATEEDYPDINASYLTFYSKTKIKGEEVFFQNKSSGTVKIAANIGVIIGKGKDMSRIVAMIRKLPVLPLLLTYNSYIDVRDVAKGLLFLSEFGINNERYILTSYNITNKEFLSNVAKKLEVKALSFFIPMQVLRLIHFSIQMFFSPFLHIDSWKSMTENKRFSTNKIKQLGWSPKFSLDESIEYLIST